MAVLRVAKMGNPVLIRESRSVNILLGMVLSACLLCPAAALGAAPDAITTDGGRYYGPLVNGKLHGEGRIEWENGGAYEGSFANGLMSGRGRVKFGNGSTYEGELRDGLLSGRGRFEVPGREIYEGEFKLDFYWGRGEVRYADGRSYRGEFARGEYQGKGRLETPNGEVYEGDFSKGELAGGTLKRKDGSHYEGGFKDWGFHGRGRYADAAGGVWEGNFSDGRLGGKGKATGKGGTYEGEFKDWTFHGHGELTLPNGDVYRGEFAHGLYEGKGTLTYAKPRTDGRKQDSGIWHYGSLAGDDGERDKTRSNVEIALYAQKALLDSAFASLKPREAGKVNLYLLAVAGDGSQEVFRREVEFVREQFARRFGTDGRSIVLVNSRSTPGTAPMATLTSIRDTLAAIAKRMDREQDVLFLFLTSHGSPEHELSLGQNGMDLRGLRAAELARMLGESGIRWKVVVVSACYGGGFIDPLKDERTMVITAARRDRRSFGCADENDFTYFGRAFFKESLPGAGSFQDAFRKAEVLVDEWERKDVADQAKAAAGRPPEGGEPSLPQIYTGKAIEAHLKRWWAQSAR